MELFKLNKKKREIKPRPHKGAGFTLVEALAVVAIIGFLASIVLVRTGHAKKQAEDTAVQSALKEVKNLAELMYSDSLSYDGVCHPGDKTLNKKGEFGRLKDYIEQYYGEDGVIGCNDSDDGYAVISSLSTGDCWCVDYQGAAKEVILDPDKECDEMLLTITCP